MKMHDAKIPVVALGWQDTLHGPAKLLVNDEMGSTHVYDRTKHIITATLNNVDLAGLEGFGEGSR